MKALVIEDNLDIQKEIRDNLEKIGIQTDGATSPFDAEPLIESKMYDLLFCDTSLKGGPDGNRYGCQISEEFRKKQPKGIIIGMSSDEKFIEYWKGISHEFYKKPVSLETIVNIVKKYF